MPDTALSLDGIHNDRKVFNELLPSFLRVLIKWPDSFLVKKSISPFSCCAVIIFLFQVVHGRFLRFILKMSDVVKFHVRLLN